MATNSDQLIPTTEVWRTKAACASVAPDLFFPAGETGDALEQAEAAKAICAGCPVRSECLEFAIATRQQYGIWGGTTEVERRSIRRRRQEAARRQRAS
jgi:WhiB family transcriptional regulator, redox-sensing transcriptional regulator